jgi:hypothetical protein
VKRVVWRLTFAILLVVLCSGARAQAGPQQAAQKPTSGTEADPKATPAKLQTPSQVSDEQKRQFIRLLKTLPHEGEFFTEAAIDKAGPYLPVFLALTEKDIEKYDIYPFAAMSRGLCDRKEHRAYAVRYFAEIRHPLIQPMWAAMLFDGDAASPEIMRFLKDALKSEQQAKMLSEIFGPEFDNFKKRLEAHLGGQRP